MICISVKDSKSTMSWCFNSFVFILLQSIFVTKYLLSDFEDHALLHLVSICNMKNKMLNCFRRPAPETSFIKCNRILCKPLLIYLDNKLGTTHQSKHVKLIEYCGVRQIELNSISIMVNVLQMGAMVSYSNKALVIYNKNNSLIETYQLLCTTPPHSYRDESGWWRKAIKNVI